jgi:5-methylcytosine-specific restriction protein A
MPRDVPEWIGKDDNDWPPRRVYLRVWDRFGGVCQCGCGRKITAGEPWNLDHVIAVINGGRNVESNLVPLLTEHHSIKTRADVQTKAKIARIKAAHLGVKAKGRPMPGSKASKFKRKINGQVVLRDADG